MRSHLVALGRMVQLVQMEELQPGRLPEVRESPEVLALPVVSVRLEDLLDLVLELLLLTHMRRVMRRRREARVETAALRGQVVRVAPAWLA
jgi:hypothetical protein